MNLNESFILPVKGEPQFVVPDNGTDFQLEELKEAIGGGWIETVLLRNGQIMVCDDEGRIKKLPINPRATLLYGSSPVHGDVLICQRNQIK